MEDALFGKRGFDRREVEVRDIDLAADAVGFRDQRMNLTDGTGELAVNENVGAATGMIARVFAVCDILGGLDVQKLQQRVNFALHREEGFVLAVGAEDQVARLFGKILSVDRKIDSAQLIELDCLVLHRVVAGENVQHARQDDRAHDGGIFAQRVDKLQSLAQGRVLRNADCVKRSGGDERVGDNLAVAPASCRSACLILEHRGLGIARRASLCRA